MKTIKLRHEMLLPASIQSLIWMLNHVETAHSL